MKEVKEINLILLALIVLLAAAGAAAQTGNPPPGTTGPRTVVRSDKGVAPVIPSMFEPIVTGGLLDETLVRNKPLAAVFESESVRTLSNGTTAVRRVTTRIYRDGDGRTRREQIFHPVGATPSPGAAAQTIFVYDPVARWSYSIDPATHTATRHRLPATPAAGAPFNNQIPLVTKILRNNPQTGTVSTFTLEPPRVQPLGRQPIAGVEAEGVRVTIKVPAGALGNPVQIETVYETWIVPDLRMLVKSVVSSPLGGTHTYLLTSINRTEQPRSLFEVPAGYPTREMGVKRTGVTPSSP